jgi:hypothetical protein
MCTMDMLWIVLPPETFEITLLIICILYFIAIQCKIWMIHNKQQFATKIKI